MKNAMQYRRYDKEKRDRYVRMGGHRRFGSDKPPPKKPVVKRTRLRVLSMDEVINRLKERT